MVRNHETCLPHSSHRCICRDAFYLNDFRSLFTFSLLLFLFSLSFYILISITRLTFLSALLAHYVYACFKHDAFTFLYSLSTDSADSLILLSSYPLSPISLYPLTIFFPYSSILLSLLILYFYSQHSYLIMFMFVLIMTHALPYAR